MESSLRGGKGSPLPKGAPQGFQSDIKKHQLLPQASIFFLILYSLPSFGGAAQLRALYLKHSTTSRRDEDAITGTRLFQQITADFPQPQDWESAKAMMKAGRQEGESQAGFGYRYRGVVVFAYPQGSHSWRGEWVSLERKSWRLPSQE